MRIASAQTPDIREDLAQATAYLVDVAGQAQALGAKLLCLPECFLQGYLTDVQLSRRHALDLSSREFLAVLNRLPENAPMIVAGLIEAEGEYLFNTVVVIHRRALVGRYRKRHLLGGERCFRAGDDAPTFEVDGLRFGINICSDTNFAGAAASVARQGASLLLCPSNNMLPRPVAAEWKDRHHLVRSERCRETGLWIISADVTGARDDLVAWGPTSVLNPAGEVVAKLPLDAPGLLVFDVPYSRSRG